MNWLYGRPTAAELVAAVADFLDNEVRAATDGQVNFHARVAANVLRTVERELGDESAGEVTDALGELGFTDEARAGGGDPRRRTGRPGRGRSAGTSHSGQPPIGGRPPRL